MNARFLGASKGATQAWHGSCVTSANHEFSEVNDNKSLAPKTPDHASVPLNDFHFVQESKRLSAIASLLDKSDFHFSEKRILRAARQRRDWVPQKIRAGKLDKMKNTPARNWLQIFLQEIAAAITAPFRPKRQTKIGKPEPKQKLPPAAGIETYDEIHFCHHERHGKFPAPRKFLTRNRTDSGKYVSVFQCGDQGCKEFVAAVIRNDDPQESWILFRGHNFRPRTGRPNPARWRFAAIPGRRPL